MSEQKIEVIRKSLGERLNEIAQLSPHVFASVMLTVRFTVGECSTGVSLTTNKHFSTSDLSILAFR